MNTHGDVIADAAGGREAAALVRGFAHDLRNGLNGIEMEAAQMEFLSRDEGARESLARLRRQTAGMERILKALGNRFREHRIGRVPAGDLFTAWSSRGMSIYRKGGILWKKEVGSEVIEVDLGSVADGLGEVLEMYSGPPQSAGMEVAGGLVVCRTVWKFEGPGTGWENKRMLPGLEEIFPQNGGEYEWRGGETTEVRCAFPCR